MLADHGSRVLAGGVASERSARGAGGHGRYRLGAAGRTAAREGVLEQGALLQARNHRSRDSKAPQSTETVCRVETHGLCKRALLARTDGLWRAQHM